MPRKKEKPMEHQVQIPSEFVEHKTTLDEAIDIIAVHLESGGKFTSTQLDFFAEAIVRSGLPDSELDWIHEIQTSNCCPLWIVLLAQFRRCHERGEANALLLDPGWEELVQQLAKEKQNAAKV